MTTPNDPDVRKNALEREVRTLRKQRTELDVQLSPLQSEREEIKSELRRREEELAQLETRISPLQSKRDRIESALRSKEEELAALGRDPTEPDSPNDQGRKSWDTEFSIHPKDKDYVRDSIHIGGC